MADFCQQCSEELFDRDYNDLANLGDLNVPLQEGEGYPVICEGCGFIRVDRAGQCLGDDDCLRKHRVPSTIFLKSKDEV